MPELRELSAESEIIKNSVAQQEADLIDALSPEQRADWQRQNEKREALNAEQAAADARRQEEARRQLENDPNPAVRELIAGNRASNKPPRASWLDKLKNLVG